MNPHLRTLPSRARRRALTLAIATRRRDDHVTVVHDGQATDCVCELGDTYFAKRSSRGCPCQKRRRGRPRVAGGMCKIGARGRIYLWRNQARQINGLVCRRHEHADDDPVAVLAPVSPR